LIGFVRVTDDVFIMILTTLSIKHSFDISYQENLAVQANNLSYVLSNLIRISASLDVFLVRFSVKI